MSSGHGGSDFSLPVITPPSELLIPRPHNPLVDIAEANLASEFCARLFAAMLQFDAALDPRLEVGVQLVNFGEAVTFHIEHLGAWNPSLVWFSGHTEEGDPVQLIQHVSQISVLLVALPRESPDEPRRQIGFHTEESS